MSFNLGVIIGVFIGGVVVVFVVVVLVIFCCYKKKIKFDKFGVLSYWFLLFLYGSSIDYSKVLISLVKSGKSGVGSYVFLVLFNLGRYFSFVEF